MSFEGIMLLGYFNEHIQTCKVCEDKFDEIRKHSGITKILDSMEKGSHKFGKGIRN